MRIEGSHRFSVPRAEVWRALQDPEILSRTLPGVRRLEVVAPDRYALTALVGVGAVRGTYDGTFSVEDKREPESCLLRGSGRGAPGMAEIEARVRLEEQDGATLLTYDADSTVTGALAGVGQRLVSAAARRNAQEFLDAVERALAAPAPAAARTAPEEGRVFERPVAAAPRDLRAFAAGAAFGFALTLAGVALGRWSARR